MRMCVLLLSFLMRKKRYYIVHEQCNKEPSQATTCVFVPRIRELCIKPLDSESCFLCFLSLVIHALQYLLFPRGYICQGREREQD